MRWISTGLPMLTMLAGVVVGCGGGTTTSSAPATAGTIRPITQGQVDVGHYRSADGVYGLVLDRTGGAAKVKIDGEKDIIELTRREDRVTRSGQGPSGSLRGYVFLKPDGTQVLYVTTGGSVIFFHGRDELEMLSDAEAAPLAAATVKGQAKEPVVEKSETEKVREALAVHAIRTKQPGMTSEHANDLAKVAAAIAAADADSFFTFVAGPDHHGRYAPIAKNSGDMFDAQKPVTTKAGLGKYDATLFPYLELTSNREDLKIAGLQVSRPVATPADKTPGVLWEVTHDGVVFVTLDGGRYLLDVSGSAPIKPGLAPSSQWPAALQHSALGPPSIEYLGEEGLVAKPVAAEVAATQTEWHNCAKAEVTKLKPQLEAIDRENTNWSTKAARRKDAEAKWETATIAKCAAKQTKMESLLVTQIEARNKERLGVLEKAKARAVALKITQ